MNGALRKRTRIKGNTEKLPEEVITEIFLILRDSCTEYNNTGTGTRDERASPLKDWTVVTRVCRRWRDIAINYPRLWTTLDLTIHSKDRLKVFLARSKDFPLDIDKRALCSESHRPGIPCWDCQDNLLYAVGNIRRIRSINAKCFESDDFYPTDDEDGPVLEEINLSMTRNSGIPEPPTIVDHFYGVTPALRRVKLEGCMFSERAMRRLFRGLTHLSITDSYDAPDRFQRFSEYYLSVAELQQVLKDCPELAKLELGLTDDFQRPFPECCDPLPEIRGTICLPKLETLLIGQIEVDAAEKLFASLDLPSLINITIGIRQSDLAEAPRILSILNNLGRGQLPGNLLVEFDETTTNFIAKRDKQTSIAKAVSSLRFSLLHLTDEDDEDEDDIMYSDLPSPDDIMRTAAELVRGTSWGSLNTLKLYVGCRSPMVRDLWIEFFKTVPNLSVLIWESESGCKNEELLLRSSNCFLSALTPMKGDSQVALPALREFVICFPDITDMKPAISKLLLKRKESNHPLVFIKFDRCDPKSGYLRWLKSLRKYVREVDWRD